MKQRRFRQSAARAGAVALEPRTFLSAGPASLVKDVNPITLSSNPDYHVQLGDVLLFRADDGVHGNEWFVSDGTAGGTTLLKDINPGAASSLSPVRTPDVYFNRMAVVGDTLYFTADEGTASGRAGVELWKTDGTPTGTVRVKDIAPGPSGSLPEFLTAVGDALYFRATEPSAGAELWTSDGTEGGTRRVADIVPGVGGPGPVPLAGLGGRLILSAWSPTDGYELWSSDGTAAGTTLLKNINPAGASDPGINSFVQLGGRAEAVVVGGEVYFAARDAEFGRELWKADGTADGTVRVTDLPALNAEPQHLMDVSGKAYFVNYPVQGQGTPKTVYRVDSSLPGGVDPIGQIDWGNVHEAHLGVVGGKLYFAGPSQDKIGLFTHDPASPAGTQMSFVKALPFFSNVTATGLFADVGGVAYFRSHVSDLWRSDGTEAGTQQVFESRPRSPIQTESASRWRVVSGPGDALYFTADDPATGTELYRWDGTPNGTGRMLDLNTITANGVTTVGAPLPDGRLLFAGNDGSRGTELWVTDGTEAGTRLLKEVWPGELSGVVTGPAVVPNETRLGAAFNGRVYFSAGHLDGRELWASDGTEAGTVMVKDINPGVGSSSPEEFTIFRGRLYFRASAGLVDRELWSTDGTAGGTVRVKDINLDGASDPSRLTVVGDMMYFTAFENEHGRELWKTDGTDAGTVLVANITGGAFSSDPQSLTAWQGKLFFSAITSPEGRELWVSDGTGATLVRDLTPTAANFDSIPLKLTPAKLGLLFEAGPTNARDIYVSDGTGDNTVRLRDLGGGSGTSLGTLTLLGVLDGWAYFFNVYPGELPGTLWMELWKSDGGPMAAQKVATLLGPGSPLGNTQALGEADGFLYFRMQSPLGIELWRTDGTEAGTATVQDVFPGTGHGSPVNFAAAGGRVYFTANDGTHGGELWSMLTRPVERAEPGVVYRGSRFDDAVAPDKAALRAGGTVSTANVTSYDRGINQVVVEMPGGLPGGVTADDFVFRVGRGGDPATWPIAPAPTSVELLPRVLGESPRYRITWTDGAIRNNWLQVTVKDNGRTGLARPDVFYFGNLVGETVATIGGAAAVGPSDYAATRAAIGRRGGIADPADHNRDGRVDLRDLVLVRRNYFQTLTPIEAAPATLTSAPRRLAVRRAWEGVDTVPAGVR